MGLRINTNVASLIAQRNLAAVTERIGQRFRRLATGLRINSAADDPAGLAMSERLRSQIRSLEAGRRNALDGVSLVQTAEGALNEVGNILQRLRELSVQSANGTVSAADRATLDEEFQTLVDEIDRIAAGTEFNGIRLLDGSASTVNFAIEFGGGGLSLALSPVLSTSLGLDGLDIDSALDASAAMDALDTALDSVSSLRGRLGAMQNRLDYSISNLGNQIENLSAAESRIRDVDIARETAELAKDQILQQATVAILAQANTQPQFALQLIQSAGVR